MQKQKKTVRDRVISWKPGREIALAKLSPVRQVLHLQLTIGKRAVMRLLRNYNIGNGVPDENSFKITALESLATDFRNAARRCLVEGLEAINESVDENGNLLDFIFYSRQPGAAQLPVPGAERTGLVYLDVRIKEVSCQLDETLRNAGVVEMETCIRHQLCWAVRVKEDSIGSIQVKSPIPFHHYYPLARIRHRAGQQKKNV